MDRILTRGYLIMNIRAWKDPEASTYVVQVGDDMYEMDHKADNPLGLCQYIGTAADLAWTVRDAPVDMIPLGIVRQIVNLTGERNNGI